MYTQIKIAILLMDTQGLFDNQSCNKINQTIFYLSTLMSSIQIFNIKEKLDKNKLHFINLFCEIAKGALESKAEKPFQVL